MTATQVVMVRRGLLLAVALVVLLLIWSYFAVGGVQDATNNAQLSSLFDQLNPGIAGTGDSDDSSSDYAGYAGT